MKYYSMSPWHRNKQSNLSAAYLFRASEIELAGSNMAVGSLSASIRYE